MEKDHMNPVETEPEAASAVEATRKPGGLEEAVESSVQPLAQTAQAAAKDVRAALLAERRKLAHLTQTHVRESGFVHDPIEDDSKIGPLIKRAERMANRQTRDCNVLMGRCYMVWAVQREILKKQYDIEWFSLDEMNDNLTFD